MTVHIKPFGRLSCVTLFVLLAFILAANARVTIDLDEGWLFYRGEPGTAMMPEFDDSNWHPVNLPHDWSVAGPFSPDYGSGNGYAPGGIGWYRKHFTIPASAQGKILRLDFDGVFRDSRVWVNGHFLGEHQSGFTPFSYDITQIAKADERSLLTQPDCPVRGCSRLHLGQQVTDYRHRFY